MWYEWLIFAIIFLLIPIAVANLKLIAEKKINPTEEQKKNANIFCGFLMLFYWLCDLFYMAFILNSLALKFVFGGLIMLIIFYNLSKAFISGASHFKWGLIQDFIVGVGMSIYLIYIIPNADLQNVVIPIVSAVYGGLITLVGVAWTIRKADSDKRENELKHAIPYLQIEHTNVKDTYTRVIDIGQNSPHYCCIITNIGLEICVLKYVLADGKYYNIENGYIAANDTVLLRFCFYFDEVSEILACDRLGNSYKFEVTNENGRIKYTGLPQTFDLTSIKETQ